MKKHTGPTLAQLQTGFDAIRRNLPAKVANKGRNFFVDNFRRQGFFGSNGIDKWPNRKKQDGGAQRNILVKTGALRRSLTASHTVNLAKVAVVGPAKRYAGIHNMGGQVSNPGGQPYIIIPANKASTSLTRRFPQRGGKVMVFLKRNRANMPKNVRYTKPFTFNMPQRQFIGNSNVLNRQLLVMVHKDIRAIINQR